MGREITPQEKFWQGKFGTEYISRNSDAILLRSNEAFFARLLRHTVKINSVIEFGANVGMNLRAIQHFIPDIEIAGIETNEKAASILDQIPEIKVFQQSIYDFVPKRQWNLALIKTVLIHIPPDMLPLVYELLVRSSDRYVCIAEYYSPTPVEIEYRGHKNKLFKRDFAGEMLDLYPELQLIDYGFLYSRDPYFPQDDINWFLLEKFV